MHKPSKKLKVYAKRLAMAGKGDRYRKVDLKKYGENYDAIFKKGKHEHSTTRGTSIRLRGSKSQDRKSRD
jgi:hypothetical protein